MTKDDGFAVMDVASDLHLDAKFKRIERLAPGKGIIALGVYVGVLGECWRTAERLTVTDAWPIHLAPVDDDLVAVMMTVGLLDAAGQIPEAAWVEWFERVQERRQSIRERWRRGNKNRAATSRLPRSNNGEAPRGYREETAAIRSVPSVPPSNGGTERERAGALAGSAPRAPELIEVCAVCRQRDVLGLDGYVTAHPPMDALPGSKGAEEECLGTGKHPAVIRLQATNV